MTSATVESNTDRGRLGAGRLKQSTFRRVVRAVSTAITLVLTAFFWPDVYHELRSGNVLPGTAALFSIGAAPTIVSVWFQWLETSDRGREMWKKCAEIVASRAANKLRRLVKEVLEWTPTLGLLLYYVASAALAGRACWIALFEQHLWTGVDWVCTGLSAIAYVPLQLWLIRKYRLMKKTAVPTALAGSTRMMTQATMAMNGMIIGASLAPSVILELLIFSGARAPSPVFQYLEKRTQGNLVLVLLEAVIGGTIILMLINWLVVYLAS